MSITGEPMTGPAEKAVDGPDGDPAARAAGAGAERPPETSARKRGEAPAEPPDDRPAAEPGTVGGAESAAGTASRRAAKTAGAEPESAMDAGTADVGESVSVTGAGAADVGESESAMDAGTADGDELVAGTDDGGGADRGERRDRRPARFRRALAMALLLALAGAGLQVMAARARHSPVTRDHALVDTETTSIVIGDVSNGLAKIFSYAPDSTAATEQAAADVLGGAALAQYRTLFAQVKERAAGERLTVTTHVVQAGVTRLSGNTAHLLVFLDQIVSRKDRPEGTPVAAQLSVTARLVAGHWRIIEIHAR